MREIEARIDIDASPERVWRVLTDFDRFPVWSPSIRRISGPLRQGAQIEFEGTLEGGRSMRFQPTLLTVSPNRELRWLGRLWRPGLFDGEHRFLIEPLDENRSRLIQSEQFRGLLVPILFAMIGKSTLRSFEPTNTALKARAESGA